MLSDIDIAQKATMKKIQEIAAGLGIPEDELEPYGRYKAKVSLNYVDSLKSRKNGKLVLVTAISPTPAGEGKTTTTVGLGDALNHIGKKAIICLREPSLGPVFGMKGGAAGGGYAQVVPMEDINLHFTGDFSAIALANNLLAALLDNHINHGNELGIDVRRVVWKRVVDMNDRALRDITIALGGPGNGYPRQDGFDIVVASEIMAIFCLATSIKDLKARIGKIVVAYTKDQKPILAKDLNAQGAMTALLKDALLPNLVQTLENNPAFIHGGPFARADYWGRFSFGVREAQIFASRGYAVIVPNFRITPGFGGKIYYSGFGTVGRQMSEDHEDAVKWGISQGFVDPSKVCISGASYGGFAALMAMAKTPEMFKCAVSGLMVSDYKLQLTSQNGDTANNELGVKFWKKAHGSEDLSSQTVRDISPVFLADKIKGPVFIYAGEDDIRTPIEQTRNMIAALTKAGNPPKDVVIKAEEGHGFGKLENNIDLYNRMLKFLAEHLGTPAK